jgi:hypothetical protein
MLISHPARTGPSQRFHNFVTPLSHEKARTVMLLRPPLITVKPRTTSFGAQVPVAQRRKAVVQ